MFRLVALLACLGLSCASRLSGPDAMRIVKKMALKMPKHQAALADSVSLRGHESLEASLYIQVEKCDYPNNGYGQVSGYVLGKCVGGSGSDDDSSSYIKYTESTATSNIGGYPQLTYIVTAYTDSACTIPSGVTYPLQAASTTCSAEAKAANETSSASYTSSIKEPSNSAVYK